MPDTIAQPPEIEAVSLARRDFGFRLGRLSRWWRGQLDERLKPLDLTQARWVVLVNLRRGGEGMLQKDLARFIGIEGPTLVRVLDYLEENGLIERQADMTDRRAKTVHLTDSGRRKLSDIDRLTSGFRDQLLDGISDEDLQTCISVFERILANGCKTNSEGTTAPTS